MTIPFLIAYEPYEIPLDSRVVYNINDMVRISSTLPEKIDYEIGSIENLDGLITVQNLTTNAQLEITVIFNKDALIIDNLDVTTPMVFIIAPLDRRDLSVSLNKEVLDTSTKYDPIAATVNFTVRNLLNGTLVFTNV